MTWVDNAVSITDTDVENVLKALDYNGPSLAERCHMRALLIAFAIYTERNEKYQDNWRRMGYRGVLIRVRERAERLWDSLWDHPTPERPADDLLDDAFDLINFAAFLVRATTWGETTRDGEWFS